MLGNFAEAGLFLLRTLGYIYFLFLMLRFLMQASRVDFYNPICQAVTMLTNPVVAPLKGLLPTVRGLDLATLFAALAVQLLVAAAIALLLGYAVFQPVYVAWALVGALASIFDLYFVALIVLVVVSWVAPYSRHPGVALVVQLTEPLCAPVRRILPPVGGLDFSVMAVLLGLVVLDSYLLVRPLAVSLGASPLLIVGL